MSDAIEKLKQIQNDYIKGYLAIVEQVIAEIPTLDKDEHGGLMLGTHGDVWIIDGVPFESLSYVYYGSDELSFQNMLTDEWIKISLDDLLARGVNVR